jgi:23S rRNA pseudouridine2605 synthase
MIDQGMKPKKKRYRNMALQSVIKLLTAAGMGSRRKMAGIISRGGVTVNDRTIESYNEQVDPEKDLIKVDGKRVSTRIEPRVYLMLNKPKGVISSTLHEKGEKIIMDILPQKYRHLRINPVGRLDKDSSGLILLTNDGDLTYHLTHPRFEKEKEYLVKIDGSLKPQEKIMLEHGVDIDGVKTSPDRVESSKEPSFNYSIIIHEGKKRQVRRMFAALGYTVLELKRIRFDNLRLNALKEGETRELTPEEVKSLKLV